MAEPMTRSQAAEPFDADPARVDAAGQSDASQPAVLRNARRVVAQNQMSRESAAILIRALDAYETALARIAELEQAMLAWHAARDADRFDIGRMQAAERRLERLATAAGQPAQPAAGGERR